MRIRKKKDSVKADFEQFLKDNHCTYTTTQEDSGTTIFSFEFQAGHFLAAIRRQDDCIEVTYPTFATLPMSQLPLVRSKCNDHNNSNILFKYSYSIDPESSEVNVHLSFFNNLFNAESMVTELKAAFHFQRDWMRDFDEAVAIGRDYDNADLESEIYKHRHEMYLMRRQELKHQMGTAAAIAAGTGPLPLWQLLETVCPLPESRLLFMTVNTLDGQQRIDDDSAMRGFDLRHALVQGSGNQARLARDYAVIDLHYKQGHDEKPVMAVISITAEGEDEHSIYSRVTVTLPVRNASRMVSLSNEERKAHSASMLIALDRSDDKQHQQEFEYMWSDARLKARNGEQDSLTEEQQMLSQVYQCDVAYNLYWGQQMFHAGRYYEAILHLENVYNSFRSGFFEMKSGDKHVFMEVAYKLGFCYNELGLHKQAFYYLDLMANDGNIRHTMELVNAMANGKDLRLFQYSDGVMEEIKQNFGDDEVLPDNIQDFINFLRRRRAYACIDFDQLDQAEKIFTQMLNEEDNADYAIHELAYIKRLRQQRGQDATASSPQSPDAGKQDNSEGQD